MALTGVISPMTYALWGHPWHPASLPRAPWSGVLQGRWGGAPPDQSCLRMQVGRRGGQFGCPPRALHSLSPASWFPIQTPPPPPMGAQDGLPLQPPSGMEMRGEGGRRGSSLTEVPVVGLSMCHSPCSATQKIRVIQILALPGDNCRFLLLMAAPGGEGG